MKIRDFYEHIDKFAPFKLSDKLCEADGCYDNSGIIIDREGDITGVTFALDFTEKAVDKAIENGSELIVTHHPAIYRGIERIDGAYVKAIKNGIGVISAHLNLDCAKDGVDACFARSLGAKNESVVTDFGNGEGYGRIFSVDKTLKEFADEAESSLDSPCIKYGDANKKIKSVASFCGAGLSEKEIDNVKADLYCSADVSHHVIKYALDKGSCVLVFTHYGSEKGGIMNLYKHFLNSKAIIDSKIKIYFFDDERFS